jgi:hypothetical protein
VIATTIPSKHLQSSCLGFLMGNSGKKLGFSFLLSHSVSLYSVWCVGLGLRVRRGIGFLWNMVISSCFYLCMFSEIRHRSILKNKEAGGGECIASS